MSGTLVSCIVPVLDPQFLEESLQSVFAQSYRPLEVLIVADGTTDGVAAAIAAQGAQGARVTWVRQPSRGPAAARNAGVRAAHGEYIAFLDADDLWEPEKTTRQMARLQAAPTVDLCFTRFQNFWAPDLADEADEYRDHALAQPSAAWSIGTFLAHRGVFERFGPFDEALHFGANMTWFLHAAGRRARIEVLPQVLMRRRLHRGNLTRLSTGCDDFFPILKAWRDYRRKAGDE